jgi:hypothetical protein
MADRENYMRMVTAMHDWWLNNTILESRTDTRELNWNVPHNLWGDERNSLGRDSKHFTSTKDRLCFSTIVYSNSLQHTSYTP